MLVLRAAGRAAADVPRARQRRHAWTTSSASRAIYLRPDRCRSCWSATPRRFAPQLRGVGFGTFETVEMADLDLIAADFKKAGRGRRAAGRVRTRRRHDRPPVRATARRRRHGWRLSARQRSRTGRVAAGGRRDGRALLDKVDRGQGRLGDAARHQEHQAATAADDASARTDRRGRDDHLSRSIPNRVRVETKRRRACRCAGVSTASAAGSGSERRARRARAGDPRHAR